MIYGVDISNNNGPVNLGDEKVSFGIAKATEGTNFRDSLFPLFWKGMAELNMLRGAYLFMDAGADPKSQAEYFVSFVKAEGLAADDLLALDVEGTGHTNASVKACVAEIGALTGKNVFIYTTYSLIAEHLFTGLYNQPLWIANPGGRVGAPNNVSPFPVWSIQQYSWATIDKNVFNGGTAVWQALVNKAKPKPVPVPPPVAAEESDMIIVTPDEKHLPPGKTWPGDFLMFAGGTLHHINGSADGVDNLSSYQAAGIKGPVTITWAEYEALGGK